jgi:hypothetical protein
MTMRRSVIVILALVLAAVVIVAATSIGYFAVSTSTSTTISESTTGSSTLQSTKSSSSTTAESSSSTVTQSFSTNSSEDGLVLSAAVSPQSPTADQNLSITISLSNGRSTPTNISVSNDWTINGFPVAMWGACNGLEPIEFMVVRGNSSVEQLSSASANSSVYEAARYPLGCPEGVSENYLEFQPNSSVANATGTFCGGACSPESHLWNLTSIFSVSGYWAYPINSSEAEDVSTPPNPECLSSGIPDCITFNYPEVGPFAQHAFIPGVYTLAVVDEWGQTVVLHFAVTATTTSTVTVSASGVPLGCAFAKTVTMGGVTMDIYLSQAPALGSTVCIYDHIEGTPPEFPEGITFTITNSTSSVLFRGQCVGIEGETGSCSTSWDTSQSYKGSFPAGGSYRLLVSFGGENMDTGISFILSS